MDFCVEKIESHWFRLRSSLQVTLGGLLSHVAVQRRHLGR